MSGLHAAAEAPSRIDLTLKTVDVLKLLVLTDMQEA